MTKNFSALRRGVGIAVGTSNDTKPLGPDLALVGASVDVLIDNRGAADAYFLLGGPDVTAVVAEAFRIPAGAIAVYGKGNATHIATVGVQATNLVVFLGEGL